MARKVADRKLDTKAERRRLPSSSKPYYREVGQGLHLGFRKGKRFGTWVVRLYVGSRDYTVESIGRADDEMTDADGQTILTWHQAVERARERQRIRTSAAGKIVGPYTITKAVEDYLSSISGKSSAYDSRKRAELSILPELGKLEVATVTAERIRSWHSGIAARPPTTRCKTGEVPDSPRRYRKFDPTDADAVRRRRATANRTLTVLKAALNLAFREGKVASDSEWRRVQPFASVDAARTRYLTVAEAQRLCNAANGDFRTLIQAALQTGARYGELTRLRVGDFNPDSETVAIRQSKSGRPRHVELTEEGIAFFRQTCAGRETDELMFTKITGEGWGKSHQLRPMKMASQAAKICPPVGFHALRHTWASLAVMNGVPLMVVARNLGHSDTRMVEKHYGHLAPSYLRDAIRAHAPRFGSRASEKIIPIAAKG